MAEKFKAAIIGAGNIGLSIARGLVNSKVSEVDKVTVSRRRLHMIEEVEKEGISITDNNIECIDDAKLVIVAVKPVQAEKVYREIAASLNPQKHIVVSIITGVFTADIQQWIDPKVPLFMAMPNTAIALGHSMTCVSSKNAGHEHEQFVLDIFNKMGTAVLINEELMNSATVLAACGIAFALRFMRAAAQGGIEIGFGSEMSTLIAAQTLKGASELILTSGHHPEREIDKVTTPQGITISGLNEMEHNGFSSALIKGLMASYNKISKIK